MKKVLLTLAVVALTTTFAHADGDTVTWNIVQLELSNPTTNYLWKSQTQIATNYGEYSYEYDIVRVDADFGFPLGWQNVTSTLEEYAGENMSGTGTVTGPAPVTLFDEQVQNDSPAATIDMVASLDGDGYANVLIREMNVGSLPIVGTPSAFRLWVDVTATPLGDPVPEPISMILFGAGALPMVLRRKK